MVSGAGARGAVAAGARLSRSLARRREGAAAALRVPLPAGERCVTAPACGKPGRAVPGTCRGRRLPALRTRVGAFSLVPNPPVPSHRGARAGPAPPEEREPRPPPSPAAWALERFWMLVFSGGSDPVAGGHHGVVEQQVTPVVQRALPEGARRAEPCPVLPPCRSHPAALSRPQSSQVCVPSLGLCAAGVTGGRDVRRTPQC